MALSLTVSKITQDAAGHVHVSFSDGTALEFLSRADALAWAQPPDVSSAEAKDLLRRLLAAWWVKQDPSGSTPSLVVGKTITITLIGATLVTVA